MSLGAVGKSPATCARQSLAAGARQAQLPRNCTVHSLACFASVQAAPLLLAKRPFNLPVGTTSNAFL
eukprot:10220967-Lingulodinium_polyedra.AAC.1